MRMEESLFRLAQPFGDEITAGHGDEGGVLSFGGHRFGDVRLAGAGWTEQKNALPWSPFP